MQVIRTGVTRTVILTSRYAIKIPSLRGGSSNCWLESFAWGLLANLSERRWHGFDAWRGMVAPVLHSWLGGIVQIYPRCDPLSPGYAGDMPKLDPDPGDPTPDNFGVLDGRIVRLDYDMR